LFIPSGRLGWLPVSFLLHVKYTLSYRVVSYRIWFYWNLVLWSSLPIGRADKLLVVIRIQIPDQYSTFFRIAE